MLSAIRLLLAVQIHTNQSKQLAFRQIFSFVLAQRDAFIHALQQVALAPTLTSMKVVEAILQLLKQCLAVVTEEDMVSAKSWQKLGVLTNCCLRSRLRPLVDCIWLFSA